MQVVRPTRRSLTHARIRREVAKGIHPRIPATPMHTIVSMRFDAPDRTRFTVVGMREMTVCAPE